jgi:hypothetical protein
MRKFTDKYDVASLYVLTDALSAASAARTATEGVSFPQGLTERWTFMVALIVIATLGAQVTVRWLRPRCTGTRVAPGS